MVNVYDYAHNLARALKECQEYRTYQSARQRLKAKPSAEQMVKDFHRKQLELQALTLQGKEPSQEQQEGLRKLYEVLSADPDIREYLLAEQRLSVLLSDVYKILGEAIEVDLPDLKG
jgi:cell fate (sporulation/competence/biofilm development) regulator YlbF (YheA/YmcA/DUF963 family)